MRRHGLRKFPIFISLCIVCIVNITGDNIDPSSSILRHLNGNSKKLLLILLPPGGVHRSNLKTEDSAEDHSVESSEEDDRADSDTKDDEAYFLYHILRTTENNGNVDENMARTIQKTKSFLHPILRARCERLEKCKKKCPEKKKKSCVKKCKVKIDIFVVCEPAKKKKCKKQKCTKTLPPTW
ncbi:uncharacterized protein [Battus philenor]|uniref:uncharacterized protein n=1 Tax=Battus philenor TaxID=42288 RepID=UPI0035CFB347